VSDKLENIDITLRSEEVQEVLTTPPSWIIRWGITIIFALTIITIVLSFMIKYPDFVLAKVLITTQSPTERIISKVPGKIEYFFVSNRDTVFPKQPLAVIKNTANYNDVLRLKSVIENTSFDLSEFYFPIDTISGLLLGDVEDAYVNFEKNYINYRLLNDLQPYSNQLMGDKESLKEIKERLDNYIDQKKILEKEQLLKKKEYDRNKHLYDKGVISMQEFENMQSEYIQMDKNIISMAVSISQMRETLFKANRTIRSTIISEKEERTINLKELAQSFNNLKKAVRNWELNYLFISSIHGIVSFHEYWGKNQYIGSNEVIFSILPVKNSAIIGKLTVSSQNAGKIQPGQKVQIKVDNFPSQQYGKLIGTVKNISISPDSEGNYFVYISLPKTLKTTYNKTLIFDQELLGNAEIIMEDLSLAERIFYKFREIFTK